MSTPTNSIESSAARRVSRRPTRHFEGHSTWVRCVAYFPDGRHIASASDDRTVIVWDVESGKQDGQPLQHDSKVLWIAISPDGRRITSGVYQGGMVIWDALRREVVREIKGDVYRVAYSPDGRWIAATSMGIKGVVRLWDADTGEPGREPLKCDDEVFYVAFSPNRSQIAVGFQDGFFRVFDISTGESVVGPIKGHTDIVSSVVYSPDGHFLITASFDKSIRVWDSKTGVQVGKPMLGHKNHVYSISITADGRRIVAAGLDIRVWDLETRLQIGDSFFTDYGIFSVAFSPNGQYIISSSGNDVCLWDAASFAIQGSVFKGHTEDVWCVAYFPDGRHIASASGDKTVIIWDIKSGRQDGQPLQHDSSIKRHYVHRLAYSPDGRWIATGGQRVVRLWDADTGRPGRELLECGGYVTCVTFSPDGSRIAAGCDDGSFQVIDVSTGEVVVGPIKGHTKLVASVMYSPDGRLLITGSWDSSIRVWDSKTGLEVGKPMWHGRDVNCISITADGRRIANAGYDKTVRVWDLETRLQVGDSFDATVSVAFSPDGRSVISNKGNDVHLWDTESLVIQGSVSIFNLLQYSF
ncbi:WD40 repeat-like protein [Leucogyrophana mollusca]|uniref:WD40 repeat-like protein n=1 Tax=Leucogyrophana mollusca TaxID=85980 RepID=A0ACB8B1T0_9AGAM|nr:WD40 repeat-like protein [Leucogyrophana mollusca]